MPQPLMLEFRGSKEATSQELLRTELEKVGLEGNYALTLWTTSRTDRDESYIQMSRARGAKAVDLRVVSISTIGERWDTHYTLFRKDEAQESLYDHLLRLFGSEKRLIGSPSPTVAPRVVRPGPEDPATGFLPDMLAHLNVHWFAANEAWSLLFKSYGTATKQSMAQTLQKLVGLGHLEQDPSSKEYRLTDAGIQKASGLKAVA